MAKSNRMVFGINDSEYPTRISKNINGKKITLWRCPFYQAWTNMFVRCYNPKYHEKCPTYIGCSVASEWHSFAAFRRWMANHPWEGNQLDKDILAPGNKQYCPSLCVFVPRKLNMFLVDQESVRGEWPIGVYWNIEGSQFQAQCSNPFTGKHEYLGRFDNPGSAHHAWLRRKHQHAIRYADMQDDPRIANALRTRFLRENS